MKSQKPTCQEDATATYLPFYSHNELHPIPDLTRVGYYRLWQKPSGWQTVRELTGIMGGIGIMALVTLLEGPEHHH